MPRRYANPHDARLVRWLIDAGLNNCQISRATAIPLSTVQAWRKRSEAWPEDRRTLGRWAPCPRCDDRSMDEAGYAYLLGLYLGDGYIVHNRRGVYLLSIFLDKKYPLIVRSAAQAMSKVKGGRTPAAMRPQEGCFQVCLSWKHWPCLFPQHGPGPKHTRQIQLRDWQQTMVGRQTQELIRGLIHSDGSRFINRVHNGRNRSRRYEYPRYLFTNNSSDILGIFSNALDACGISWRRSRWNAISVARQSEVAKLDAFVGPKR